MAPIVAGCCPHILDSLFAAVGVASNWGMPHGSQPGAVSRCARKGCPDVDLILGQFLVTDLVKVLHVSWFLLILLALLGVRCV